MRRIFLAPVLVLSATLGVGDPGLANDHRHNRQTTLYSVPVNTPSGAGISHSCLVLNVSDTPVSGELACFRTSAFEGTVPAGAAVFVDRQPLSVFGFGAGQDFWPGGPLFCRVTFDGKPKDVRAQCSVSVDGVVTIGPLPLE